MSDVRVYDAEGNLVSTRPMTSDEQAFQDAQLARAAQVDAVRLIITELQAEKTRAQVIIDKAPAQITGADTKDLARATKRIADAAIDLAKLLTE